jgi:hypothetical protein
VVGDRFWPTDDPQLLINQGNQVERHVRITLRQAHADQLASESKPRHGLRVHLGARGALEHNPGPAASDLLHLGRQIFVRRERGEVEELIRAARDAQFTLGSDIDSKDSRAHGLGVLDAHVTDTAAGTRDGYPLAGSELSSLETIVDGDAGTQERCGSRGIQCVGDGRDISAGCDAVLLEGAWSMEATYLRV